MLPSRAENSLHATKMVQQSQKRTRYTDNMTRSVRIQSFRQSQSNFLNISFLPYTDAYSEGKKSECHYILKHQKAKLETFVSTILDAAFSKLIT